MYISTLQPPNSQRFSDVVIGEVRQRLGPASQPLLTADGLSQLVSRCQVPLIDANAIIIAAARQLQGTSKKHSTARPTVVPRINRQSKNASKHPDCVTRSEFLRHRHRLTQDRYRKREAKKATTLERNVELLREEIQKLEMQYQTMSSGLEPTTPWNVAVEYFRLFRSGIPVSSEASKTRPHLLQWQEEFLEQTVAPDVAHGTFTGRDLLLEGMKQISLFHSDFDMELRALECGPNDSIVATIVSIAGIDENTLRNAFPHLIPDHQGSLPSGPDGSGEKLSSIAAKLLGHRMVVQGTVEFHWDKESKRMAGLHHKADLLTPLLQLVGSLEDVASVFEHFVLTPDAEFVRKERLQQTPVSAA